MQSSPVEITECLGVVIELLLIKAAACSSTAAESSAEVALRIEIGEALAKRQSAGQLNKANQVAALAAAVAVEDILAGVDIERRPGLLVQRTESDELGRDPQAEPVQFCCRRYSSSGSRRLSFSTSSPTALFRLRRPA